MISALTTVILQNNTTKDASILPPTTVRKCTLHFLWDISRYGCSRKFSTNTAQTAISVETPYDLQFKKKETSTLDVRNSTSSAILARNIFNEFLAYVWKTDFTLIMVQVIRSNKPFWVLLHQRSYDWLFRSLVYKFPFKFDWYIFL